MRVIAIFKDQTDYARTVINFLRDFNRQTGNQLEVMDPDTVEGANFCTIYDIVRYPTIIALSDNGQMQNIWVGLPLPTINEVSYYTK